MCVSTPAAFYFAHSSTAAVITALCSHSGAMSDGMDPCIAPRKAPSNCPRPAESPPLMIFKFIATFQSVVCDKIFKTIISPFKVKQLMHVIFTNSSMVSSGG